VLVNAMKGCFPTRASAHRTSVTPGPANRGDIAGDGPPPCPAELPEDILHPALPADHPMWKNLLEAMYRLWSALHNVPRIPEILNKYQGSWHTLYAAFVRHHKLTNRDVLRVFDDVFGDDLAPPPRAPPKAIPVRTWSMPGPTATATAAATATATAAAAAPLTAKDRQSEEITQLAKKHGGTGAASTGSRPRPVPGPGRPSPQGPPGSCRREPVPRAPAGPARMAASSADDATLLALVSLTGMAEAGKLRKIKAPRKGGIAASRLSQQESGRQRWATDEERESEALRDVPADADADADDDDFIDAPGDQDPEQSGTARMRRREDMQPAEELKNSSSSERRHVPSDLTVQSTSSSIENLRKRRRGQKRCRPGSSERRWAALERAVLTVASDADGGSL